MIFLDPPMDPEPIDESPSAGVHALPVDDDFEPIEGQTTDTSQPPPEPPPPAIPYPPLNRPPDLSWMDPEVHPHALHEGRIARLEFLVDQLLKNKPITLPAAYDELMRFRGQDGA